MNITRRQFTIGAVASLIVPSFAEQVIAHFTETGEPLMEAVTRPTIILRPTMPADVYELHDTAIEPEPPSQITWRALFERMGVSEEEGLDRWLIDRGDLENTADDGEVFDWWGTSDAPWVHAYHHLKTYEGELVTRIDWVDEYGEECRSTIEFNDGGGVHSDLFSVEASDDVALSLLQHQLNRLGTGIRIEGPDIAA